MADLVLFGVSNMLGNVFDCALMLGHRVRAVVRNQDEALRPRTRSAEERMAALDPVPEYLTLDEFRPRAGEIHFLGTTSPARAALVAELEQRFALSLTTLVHPTAHVSPLARLAGGVFVGAQAFVGPGVTIGAHAWVQTMTLVGHDSTIGPYALLRPACRIGGHCRIGEAAVIGMNAVVLEELVVGARATVAAGAVVVQDVPEGVTVVGVPAWPLVRPAQPAPAPSAADAKENGS